MEEEEYKKFLRGKGKKADVVERNCKAIKKFAAYLHKERNTNLSRLSKEDIRAYVEHLEDQKQSAKGALYSLMNYFSFIGNKELLRLVRSLREERTKKTRKIFPIKDFLKVNQDHIRKLASIGIKNVEQMLEAGKTKKQREELSKQLEIPEDAILEIVKLSDLTRIGYVKAKLTRLYYNAGLDSPLKVAKFEPDELHDFFTKFIEETGWDGMIPNPSDLVNNIANAKKLKKWVEE
ncbi:MAG: DUF4332 domain-containing protein [Asgard group archaeon]|nr:DUF4332 domain-containing protein [Asgard group archaeon]